MGSTREKRALARMLQDNVLHLCKTNAIYGGMFEVDGIISITGPKEGQELTVKIHERFGNHWSKYGNKIDFDVDRENNNSHLNFLKGIPPGMHNAFLTSPHNLPVEHLSQQQAHAPNDYESDMLDLSMNSSRNRDERSNGSDMMMYRHSPNKRMKPETPGHDYRNGGEHELDIQRSCNTSPSVGGGEDQAENLSMSAANSEDGTSVSSSPDKAMYLGKSPYIASPYHLQKKTPLKNDRWTPSTPLPTVPECRQCGFTFDTFEVLSEHNEAVHSVFTCQHCHKTFTSRSNLERHARLHTGFKPYVCAICQKAFSRKDHLSNHSAKHAYKCGHCNKRYADKPNLATHFTYEHDSILTNCCEFCNKGFGNLESYEEHVKTHPQYHAVHKTYHNTNNSRQVNSSPSAKKYTCDSCKFVSQDRITLIKHRLVHLEGQRCYTCLSCAKVFEDPLSYDDHLLAHQTETNVFECCICRQVFQSLDILKRHEIIHLNEDLNELMTSILPCPHCDKMFRGIHSLQEHIMTYHNNQSKKHRCFFCNLGFNTYSELCRHMDELRHYPPDPRMLFGMTMGGTAFDPRKYTEFMAKRNLQKELLAGRPVALETENVKQQPENNVNSQHEGSSKQDNTENNSVNNDDKEADNNQKRQDLENDIGSDIEVVEPEAPEENNMDHSQALSQNTGYQFVVTENKSSVIEIKPEDNQQNSKAAEEEGQIQLRMNGDTITAGSDNSNLSNDEKSSDTHSKSDERSEEGIENGEQQFQLKTNDRARKRKGPSPEKYVEGGEAVDMSVSEYYDSYDMESINSESSSPSSTIPSLMQSHSAAASPVPTGEAKSHHRVIDRKPREGSKTVPAKISFDIPPGPHTCSVCQMTLSNFQTLEQHCFAEHNRCPCMFCPKTFAQKANRDRHICLHTGDKPYACPECGEKFSRGDKLKLHRVRTHNIPTNPTTQFTLKRDPNANNGGNSWTIHSPSSTNHGDSDGWNVVHGAGEWSMIPEATY